MSIRLSNRPGIIAFLVLAVLILASTVLAREPNKKAMLAPPLEPSNPSPAHLETGVSRDLFVSWTGGDPDTPFVTYDVYFGKASPPPYRDSLAPNITTWWARGSGSVGFVLERGTVYYWQIVSHAAGETTSGPIWQFTTSDSNLPPTAPRGPFPINGANGVATSVVLQWLPSSDPEALWQIRYDVYFGTDASPPLFEDNVLNIWQPVGALLPGTTYYWRVVARDVDDNAVSSPVWSFHTSPTPPGDVSMALYTDESGTFCSLNDNGGMKNLYVVLDGSATFTGARFSAPKPACWNATYLYENTSFVPQGNSQSDVSVGFGYCAQPPVTMMTITYMSAGNTSGCCEYPLVAPAATGSLLATDCVFEEVAATNSPVLGISSDAGCPPCEESGFLRFSAEADTCRTGPWRRIAIDLELSPQPSADDGGVKVAFSPSLIFVSCERGTLTQNWTTFTSQLTSGVLTISGVANPGYDPTSSGVFARLTFDTNCCRWDTPAALTMFDATGDFAGLRLIDRQLTCVAPGLPTRRTTLGHVKSLYR